MTITIHQKYLTFPINTRATVKRVFFWEGEEMVLDLDCKIDMREPNFTAYVDVSRFMGKTLRLTSEPDFSFAVGYADAPLLPKLWQEPLRPQVHYTVPFGWNNDPNGLCRVGDTYHMFYQYNPCAAQWGNMHWGHATSADLLHWTTHDVALFPDERGTMFSGSAIEDRNNHSGLQRTEQAPLLLFYTAAGGTNALSEGKSYTQCVAASHDGGVSFEKLARVPVVAHIEGENRDPKVVFVPEIGRYVMCLFLAEHRFCMLTSTDLLSWEHFCELTLNADRECPDLYPLWCNGEKKWIFCGASDIYVVGHFTQKEFVIETQETKLSYSRFHYAAQSFSGTETGEVIRVYWHRLAIPDPRFSQQISFPVQMRLDHILGRYYQAALPIPAIKTLYEDETLLRDTVVQEPLRIPLQESAYDLRLSLPYVAGEELKLTLFGTKIRLDMKTNRLWCERLQCPLSLQRERVSLCIIADRCSLELYADDGHFCLTSDAQGDYNLPFVQIAASKSLTVDALEIHKLRSTLPV